MKKQKFYQHYSMNMESFTMIEMIFSLLIVSVVIIMIASCFKVISHHKTKEEVNLEDQLGIEQLRYYLACNNILSNDDGNELLIQTKDGEHYLRLVNHKIMMQSGSLTFLRDIDYIYFYYQNNRWMMEYHKNDKTQNIWIGFKSIIE